MGKPIPHFTFNKGKSFALASVAALAMSAPSMQARTISAEEALDRVMNQSETKTLNFKASPRLVYTKPLNSSETPGLYVFNNADNRGFMILSAEDETNALLGYSDSGIFDPDNIPEPLEYWLNCYTEEINSIQGTVQSSDIVPSKSRASHSYVDPLVKTNWGTNAPYNRQCPLINDEPTNPGCAAVAMAQVMKYFNYPEHGTGSTEYRWNGISLEADFESHTYDWNNMLNTYIGEYNYVQEEAVSLLVSDCAKAIQTDFKINGSTVTTIEILKAFSQFFGYDKQARYMERKFYPQSEWEEAIYDQLDNHGPLVYIGSSTISDLGYVFVCDGYSGNYFHINWGWDGLSNGFFLLSALSPAQHGTSGGSSGYNNNHIMITNIYPNQGGDYPVDLVSNLEFKINKIYSQFGNRIITYSVGILNHSAIDIVKPVIGLSFTNTSDNQTFYSNGTTVNGILYPSVGTDSPLSCQDHIPSELTEGTYIVRPVYKDLSGEWHLLPVDLSLTGSYTMTIDGNNVNYSSDNPPIPKVTEWDLLTPLYTQSIFKISVTIENPSDQDFYEPVWPCFLLDGKFFSVGSEVDISLTAHEKKQVTILSKCTLGEGEYQLGFCIGCKKDKNTIDIRNIKYISDFTAVTVTNLPQPLPEVTNLHFEDDNSDDINASQLVLTFDVTVNGGIYSDPIHLALYSSDGETLLNMLHTEYMLFKEGVTKDFTLTIDISPWVEVGKTYQFALLATKDNTLERISEYYTFTVGSLDGISNITSDQDIISCTYYTLQGLKLNGAPSDGGVYIKVDTLSDGTTQTNKVVIK